MIQLKTNNKQYSRSHVAVGRHMVLLAIQSCK